MDFAISNMDDELKTKYKRLIYVIEIEKMIVEDNPEWLR
jgi:hypothetical protein